MRAWISLPPLILAAAVAGMTSSTGIESPRQLMAMKDEQEAELDDVNMVRYKYIMLAKGTVTTIDYDKTFLL
jgi:hypothetical protein